MGKPRAPHRCPSEHGGLNDHCRRAAARSDACRSHSAAPTNKSSPIARSVARITAGLVCAGCKKQPLADCESETSPAADISTVCVGLSFRQKVPSSLPPDSQSRKRQRLFPAQGTILRPERGHYKGHALCARNFSPDNNTTGIHYTPCYNKDAGKRNDLFTPLNLPLHSTVAENLKNVRAQPQQVRASCLSVAAAGRVMLTHQ
jgi:hypothetical protein